MRLLSSPSVCTKQPQQCYRCVLLYAACKETKNKEMCQWVSRCSSRIWRGPLAKDAWTKVANGEGAWRPKKRQRTAGRPGKKKGPRLDSGETPPHLPSCKLLSHAWLPCCIQCKTWTLATPTWFPMHIPAALNSMSACILVHSLAVAVAVTTVFTYIAFQVCLAFTEVVCQVVPKPACGSEISALCMHQSIL